MSDNIEDTTTPIKVADPNAIDPEGMKGEVRWCDATYAWRHEVWACTKLVGHEGTHHTSRRTPPCLGCGGHDEHGTDYATGNPCKRPWPEQQEVELTW